MAWPPRFPYLKWAWMAEWGLALVKSAIQPRGLQVQEVPSSSVRIEIAETYF